MTLAADALTVTLLSGPGYPLGTVGGSITMDEGRAPHVWATLRVAIPDTQAVLDLLDTRAVRQFSLVATQTFPDAFTPPESRTFLVAGRTRVIDWPAGEVVLDLASDEARLMDDQLFSSTPDMSAYSLQGSLRSIVSSVLGRIGATLEPGADDATMGVRPDAINLITNPSGQTDLANTGGINLTSLTRVTGISTSPRGTAFRLTGTATSSLGFLVIGGDTGGLRLGMQPGKTYRVSGKFRLTAAMTGTAAAEARRIQVTTRIGSAAYVSVMSPAASNTVGTQELSLEFTVPEGATEAFVRFFHGHASTSTCDWHSLQVREVTADPTDTDQWDGDTADTPEYAYAWTGAVGSSASTRTALHGRSVDALRREPGTSSWEFLQPLFQTAGLRLFCNEARDWYLVSGADYVAAGATQLSYGAHLYRARDTISRDTGEWFDAAIVRYRWTGSDGTAQSAIDKYATAGYTRVRTFDIDRPYPGPGFAEYLVKRAAGKGRTLDLSALNRFTVTPSQVLRVNLPNTPVQTGVVRSVTWDLDTGVMEVGSRGLTDTPVGAWSLVNPALTWAAAPPTATWAAWINPNGV